MKKIVYIIKARREGDIGSLIANTNLAIGNLNTNLTGTNTAIRTLVSDRLQVANATATFATKAYAAANSYVNSTFIKPDDTNISFSGQSVTISGNLTVSGTTTSVNSNTVNIGDNILILNSDESGTPSQDGGIEIERGTSTNSTLLWDEGNDYWVAGVAGAEERIDKYWKRDISRESFI